jgi:hypothetical protein
MPKGDADRKELALRERQLKHHNSLMRDSSHPDHGWKLPSKEFLEKRIAKLKRKLGVSGGTRRRRRNRKTRRHH